nr:iron ABC transporter permease [Aliagarivorans marinus]
MLHTRSSLLLPLCFALGLTALLSLVSLASGPVTHNWQMLWQAITGEQAAASMIIWQLRLPRMLLTIAIGALLALAGALMQGLFRNPLADPAIIGISGGSAAGAALAMAGLSLLPAWPWLETLGVPLMAFVGGISATLLVYRLATRSDTGTSVVMLLLAGIAISAISGALISLLSYLSDDQTLRQLSLWQMGTLSRHSWGQVQLAWGACAVIAALSYKHRRTLDVLLLGEAEARYSGVDVQALKRQLILCCAFAVAIAVAITGLIGFVGLVVPHILRLMLGPGHQRLLPLSALGGACLLLFADLIARSIVAPAQLPIGVVTALIGAPFFLYLLLRQRQHLS